MFKNKVSNYIFTKEFIVDENSDSLVIINPGIANNLGLHINENKAYLYYAQKLNDLGFNVLITVPKIHIDAWNKKAGSKLNKTLYKIYDDYSNDFSNLFKKKKVKKVIFIGYSIGCYINSAIVKKNKGIIDVIGIINISPSLMFNHKDWFFSNNTWYHQMLKFNLNNKQIKSLEKKSLKKNKFVKFYKNDFNTLNLIPEIDDSFDNEFLIGITYLLKGRGHTFNLADTPIDRDEILNFWYDLWNLYILKFIL